MGKPPAEVEVAPENSFQFTIGALPVTRIHPTGSQKSAPEAKQYLTPKMLALRHLTSEGSLANDRSNGVGVPFLRLGGRHKVLYDLEDVEEYERRSRIETRV